MACFNLGLLPQKSSSAGVLAAQAQPGAPARVLGARGGVRGAELWCKAENCGAVSRSAWVDVGLTDIRAPPQMGALLASLQNSPKKASDHLLRPPAGLGRTCTLFATETQVWTCVRVSLGVNMCFYSVLPLKNL